MSPTWTDGEKVRPVDNPGDDAARTAFVTKVLGMSIADFERHWIEQQYASSGQPAGQGARRRRRDQAGEDLQGRHRLCHQRGGGGGRGGREDRPHRRLLGLIQV